MIFGDFSFVVSKESRAHGVYESVNLGMFTTVLAKLALPHFHHVMLPFQIGGGLLSFAILLGSGRLPVAIANSSCDLADMTMEITSVELEDRRFLFWGGCRHIAIHRVFSDSYLSARIQSMLNIYVTCMHNPLHPVIG